MSTVKIDRRTAILDAAIEVLANSGLAGVTHRAVDQAAGVPEGSSSYYFPKKLDLVSSIAERVAFRMDADCDAVRRHFADLVAEGQTEEATRYVAEDFINYANEGRDLVLARFELAFAGARNPELKEIADELERAAKAPLSFFLKLIFDDVTETQVDTCMSLIDGLAMRYLTGQAPKPTVEQVERIFESARD